MTNFYSNIGKGTTQCNSVPFNTRMRTNNAKLFMQSKKTFADMLKSQGYTIKEQTGNYLTVCKGNETTIIYFAWHSQKNTNYAISKYIERRVDYFAFCNNAATSAYIVSYDKMSKHCKTKHTSIIFNNKGDEKLLISDEWVHSQVGNIIF